MTESRGPAERGAAKKVRWSRQHVRALAWVAGSATFFTGVAVLGAAPKLAANASNTKKAQRLASGRVAVRHVTRKVFVVDPPSYGNFSVGGTSSGSVPVYSSGGVTYSGGTTSGGGSTTSGGGGSTGGGGTTGGGTGGGGGGTTGPPPPPPPPPPPVCHTSPSGVKTCN